MSFLKQLGDAEFKKKSYRTAIEFYTRALDEPPADEQLSVSQKRTIISNRALCFFKYGSIYEVVADCDLALSPEYNTEDADKSLSAKLYYRRATVKEMLTAYQEARADYLEFERLQQELQRPVSDQEKHLLDLITKGLRIRANSEEMDRVKLIRACHAKGLMIDMRSLKTFPRHPMFTDEEDEVTGFEDGEPGEDYLNAPLSIKFDFKTPRLQHPFRPGQPYGVTTNIPDYMTIGEHVQGIFTAIVIGGGNPPPRPWIMQAITHEDPTQSTIVAITRRGRLVKIPWTARVADIWPAVKWPRTTPCPYEVLRTPPMSWAHGIDGMEFLQGRMISMLVVPNNDLAGLITELDAGFRSMNM